MFDDEREYTSEPFFCSKYHSIFFKSADFGQFPNDTILFSIVNEENANITTVYISGDLLLIKTI